MRSLEDNNTLNQLKTEMKQSSEKKARKTAQKEQEIKEEKKLLHQGFEEIEQQMMHTNVDEKAIESEIRSTLPRQKKASPSRTTKIQSNNKQELPRISGDDFSDLFRD